MIGWSSGQWHRLWLVTVEWQLKISIILDRRLWSRQDLLNIRRAASTVWQWELWACGHLLNADSVLQLQVGQSLTEAGRGGAVVRSAGTLHCWSSAHMMMRPIVRGHWALYSRSRGSRTQHLFPVSHCWTVWPAQPPTQCSSIVWPGIGPQSHLVKTISAGLEWSHQLNCLVSEMFTGRGHACSLVMTQSSAQMPIAVTRFMVGSG